MYLGKFMNRKFEFSNQFPQFLIFKPILPYKTSISGHKFPKYWPENWPNIIQGTKSNEEQDVADAS